MRSYLLSCFVLGLFIIGCRPPASAKDPTSHTPAKIVFTDVTVVPMDANRVVPHQTVIVQGQRIVAVGPSGKVQLPAGATRIDGRGKFLMPGLADMHIHLDNKADLLLLVANGVTTARNMWGWPHHLDWRAKTASGNLLGPTIITAGPIIDGYPPARSGTVVVKTPQEARQVAERQKKAGYDFIKFYSRLSPAAFDATRGPWAARANKRQGHPSSAQALAVTGDRGDRAEGGG